MTGGFVAVKEDAADDGPNYRGVGAALACAVDWEKLAVSIKVIGDAEDCFQFIFCFF